jgi:hypothetical protein
VSAAGAILAVHDAPMTSDCPLLSQILKEKTSDKPPVVIVGNALTT